MEETANELAESWINGNRTFVLGELAEMPGFQAMAVALMVSGQLGSEAGGFLWAMERKANEYKTELCPGCGVRTEHVPATGLGLRCEDCADECDHEPDWSTLAPADDSPGIVDVGCRKCGQSGAVGLDPEAIDW